MPGRQRRREIGLTSTATASATFCGPTGRSGWSSVLSHSKNLDGSREITVAMQRCAAPVLSRDRCDARHASTSTAEPITAYRAATRGC